MHITYTTATETPIRYFVGHKVKANILSTGLETRTAARKHAKWLADTYGGTANVWNNRGEELATYSAKKGWVELTIEA